MTKYLRTSERNLFKRCQWAWERSYIDRLKTNQRESIALWFGTGIHLALENWYIPGRKRGTDPRETWRDYVNESRGNTEWVNTYHDGDFSEAVSALELGEDMLTQYLDEYGLEEHIEVISAEQTFQVPVKHKSWKSDDRTDDLLGEHCNYQVDDVTTYVGTFDMVVRDHRDGKLYVWDHKGLRMSEQVMTPDGWKANGDLAVGDLVIGSDGKPTEVTGVYDLGKRQMYRVHMQDGSYVDTTDDHYWTLWDGERSKLRTTQEVMEELEKPGQNKYVTLPKQPLVDWEPRDLPIDPYVLGAALGDGTLRSGIRMSNPDDFILNKISERYETRVEKSQPGRCRSFSIPGMAGPLRDLGLLGRTSHDKFIPESYLYSSIEQRKGILAGLLDTDGHIDTHNRIKFCTVSDQLKDGVEFLVRSLGGRAQSSSYEAYYIKEGKKHVTGRYWHVSIRMNDCPFTMPRHIERFRPPKTSLSRNIKRVEKVDKDYARCIRVSAEDSLYMTKDCIITHNTAAQLGSSNTQYLPLDDQAGAYWAIATHTLRKQGLIGPKEAISGVVYNYLRKAKADTRPRNADGYCTNKPQKKHFIEALTEKGIESPDEKKPLDKLTVAVLESLAEEHKIEVFGEVSASQPPKNLDRVTVFRHRKQMRSQIERIQDDLEVMSLVKNNLVPTTKTPTRECGFCEFREICELDESGKDYSDFAEQIYTTWDPYAAHREKEDH